MSVGLLDFFILESSECVERIDFLLSRGGASRPDVEAFARNARELRGCAQMARIPAIVEIAGALERTARGLRDGGVAWTESLRGALTAAADDLKVLIRGVRDWGPEQQRRADVRLRELNTFSPIARQRSPASPGNARFLAIEAAALADGLHSLADASGSMRGFAETLARLRALRGVAALADLPPLAEVVAAVDDAAKPIELDHSRLGDAQRGLFRSGAAVLMEGAAALDRGDRPDVDSQAVQAFTAAAAKFIDGAIDADFVVPVTSLLDDRSDAASAEESTDSRPTRTARFRLEVVSQAEHICRLVSDGRRAVDAPSRQRIGHELRGSVHALWRTAESFGEDAVARTLHSLIDGAALLHPDTLVAIDEAARILIDPGGDSIGERFEALRTPARATTPVEALRAAPAMSGRDANALTIDSAASGAATSGAALRWMLDAGLGGLADLDAEPLSEPLDVEEEEALVPIGELLFRGQTALLLAMALSDALKRSANPVSADGLAELYDLLELAASE